MRSLNQTHIVKFITAFCRGEEDYCIMLEWADGGNLRDLWKKFPRPALTGNLVKNTLEQLQGLAQALHTAHYPENPEESISYRHGDLKPENILWFKDENGHGENIGTLKIGDWGLAKAHHIVTELRTEHITTWYGSRRYEPPEKATVEGGHLKLPKRSRFHDVWAMGCIALESLIWLMYGPDELTRFNQSFRQRQGERGGFYEVDDKGITKVHRVAVRWMEHMAKDPVCIVGRTALGDLLEVIQVHLLVVELPPVLSDMSTMANIISPNFPSKSSAATIDPRVSFSSTRNVPEFTVTEPMDADEPVLRRAQLDSAPKLKRSAPRGFSRANASLFSDLMLIITSDDDQGESYWLTGVPLPPPERTTAELLLRSQESNRYETEDSKSVAVQMQPEQP